MHTNDRKALADNLGLSIDHFDRLISSANHAYNTLRDLGPFYGNEQFKDPTFRVTAEPVILPIGSKKILTQFGIDALALARALSNLPEIYKKMLGDDLVYKIPPAWRIDIILDEKGGLHINEIEGDDDASALMMGEQLAYNLQTLDRSTAARLVKTYEKMYPHAETIRIALIRPEMKKHLPVAVNTKKFIQFLHKLSKNHIQVDMIFDKDILEGKSIEWSKYNGVVNESTILPRDLKEFGVLDKQLISCGSYNALMNKGIFALIYDKELTSFWHREIGVDCLNRLQNLMPYSKFITTRKDLEIAQKDQYVVKISWAGSNITLIDRSQGVAMPEGAIEQSTTERWNSLKQLCDQGYRIIAQEYIRPGKIKAYLRKRGTNLEPVEWYNRICAKYVSEGDPNDDSTSSVSLTGVEVTLGPNLIPAGRKCAFTAGAFPEDIVTTAAQSFQPIQAVLNRPKDYE